MDSDEVYDIAVIGGGVVGCSTLFHLTNKGYRCILLEKNKHLVSEASAGNRCECGNCSSMTTPEECICCVEVPTVHSQMLSEDMQCITDSDIFISNCLNRHVLHVSMYKFLENVGPFDDNEPINDGMLHTGFDAPLGSLELHCIQQNQKQIFDILKKLDLPCHHIGATMVAWDQTQLSQLPRIMHHSKEALISDIQQLSLSELYRREPNLGSGAAGAIHIPGEAIVDPWLIPIVFAEHARSRGAKICTDTIANNFDFNKSTRIWTVSTNRGNIQSRLVINCCGLYGDVVERLVGYSSFKIRPRKGQYLIFDKAAKGVISSSILPVPSETTKGVIVFNSVYDNVIIGPTAEETNDRCATPHLDQATTTRLLNYGKKTVPPLTTHDIVRMYTGVRPATENKDYQIITRVDRNWLTIGGIRSTGLSACTGIADHAYCLVKDKYGLEPSGAAWNTIDKIYFRFTNRGTAEFQSGIEHCITHPLTITGNQCLPNSNL